MSDDIKVTAGRTTMNVDFGPSRADDAMGRHIDVVPAQLADALLRALVASPRILEEMKASGSWDAETLNRAIDLVTGVGLAAIAAATAGKP